MCVEVIVYNVSVVFWDTVYLVAYIFEKKTCFNVFNFRFNRLDQQYVQHSATLVGYDCCTFCLCQCQIVSK